MSDDKPLTPHPPSAARRASPSEEERERERWRTYAEEIEREQRLSVPPWGFELAAQISTVTGLVRSTNETATALVESVDRLRAEVQTLTERVGGRHGVEDRLERHQEAAARDLAAVTARVAVVEQWQRDRDRTDTIRVSEAQRSWWDRGVGIVGATLVGLALGGGAVGVALARGCEPAAVKGP